MTTAQPSPSPRRRWLSFSLRGMLLVVTATCIWLAVISTRARKQQQAIAHVEKLGGRVGFDYQRDSQGKRVPNGQPHAPEWLRKTVGEDYFRRVVAVDVNNSGRTKTSSKDIAVFRDLPDLVVLELSNNPITDEGLVHLSGLRDLRTLYLYYTRVRGPGLAHVPRDVAFLALSFTPLEDEGLAQLRGMSELTWLRLDQTKITDQGLAHLSELKSLKTLTLAHTDITDAGLEHLRSLTSLKGLSLGHTKVTSSGITRLQQALPNCDISPDLQWLDAKPHEVELWPEDYKPSTAEILAKVQELDGSPDVNKTRLGQPIVEFTLFDSTVSDESLIRLLAEMPDLEHLNLRRVLVGDRLAQELPRLSKLRFLSLEDSRITDQGLVHVGKIKSLEELTLLDTKVSDVGMKHLSGLTNLKSIFTGETRVTDEGRAELQQALPTCRIQK